MFYDKSTEWLKKITEWLPKITLIGSRYDGRVPDKLKVLDKYGEGVGNSDSNSGVFIPTKPSSILSKVLGRYLQRGYHNPY